MINYTEDLIKQYCNAKDESFFDLSNRYSIKSYLDYWDNMDDIALEYIDYLDDNKLSFFKSETAIEVGKGNMDSIVKPYETKILTPYNTSFPNTNNNRIYQGNLIIMDNNPLIKTNNNNLVFSNQLETFMTQNNININNLINWYKLANKYNLIIGIYGSIYDKDKQNKINDLNMLYNANNDLFEKHFDTNEDNYYYVINTPYMRYKAK